MKRLLIMVATVFVLLAGVSSVSANTLTVTPNPDGSVIIAADEGVTGAVRIDFTFSYATTLLQPRVIIQGGDFSYEQMNRDSKPGYLHLAIAREGEEMQEAAFVLIVDFDEKQNSDPCKVNFVAATYTYADGRTASPGVNLLPALEAKKPISLPEDVPQPTAASPAGRSSKPAVSLSGSGRAATTGRSTPELPVSRGPARKGDPGAGEDFTGLEYRYCPDPLQRFRDYRGDGKLAGLLHLFDFENPCGCRQTPTVALSDGSSKVSLTIEADPASENAPNFGISGGRLLSLWQNRETGWTIELLPNQGETEVVLYVITGRVLRRIPLTVAPPLDFYLSRMKPEDTLSPLLEYIIAANYRAGHREIIGQSAPAPE